MHANALICPDLQDAPKTYKGVTFYLDTPLLIRRLGLEGCLKEDAITSLVSLLTNLGASVATFSHSRRELERVIVGAAAHLNAADGRGAIVMEARRYGRTKSDLLMLVGQIDEKLAMAGIQVIPTPRYIERFQIDENAFGQVLQDEVSHFNPRAREDDINSVRSRYVLRARTAPATVERCKAVLVTNNSGFARAAFDYGQRHEESREVSSVITDFSLANIAWLKAPMGAPQLPATELLAFSYAALQPNKEMLEKFLAEIEKLQKQGVITPRDHQLLRSNVFAHDELMQLTMGDEDALTEETVTETLRRVSDEIKQEESAKLSAEQLAHQKTQEALIEETRRNANIQERLYWRCRKNAARYSWCVFAAIAVVMIAGMTVSWAAFSNLWLRWFFFGTTSVAVTLSAVNLFFGVTLMKLRGEIEQRFLDWLLIREKETTGLDLSGSK